MQRIEVADLVRILLQKYNVRVRDCSDFEGLDIPAIRISVRLRKDNERLIYALKKISGSENKSPIQKKQRPLMIQGTGSGVGKSLLTAAFCRIFAQDGYNVAPFKSQNMSLNSYVTAFGEEISRSIALQARASRIDVTAEMNPVLLKPVSNTGSQLIVMGKVKGMLGSKDFIIDRSELWRTVEEAYHGLSDKHDLLVIEGAGSPAEVNLKPFDIVNMKVALMANAAVLLAANIDTGGSFASLIGHMQTFTIDERKLVMGFLLNKFRGDKSLLGSAFEITRQYTSKDVLGVIPYIRSLNLPEEDGMFYDKKQNADAHIRVAIIAYPHISNFTDFDALYCEPDVSVTFISEKQNLKQYDLVILPGSKSVVSDLHWLIEHGIADGLRQRALQPAPIAGICGGLQLMGKEIKDPHHVESGHYSMPGLGLLPLITCLAEQKTLKRNISRHLQSATMVKGYEIHHGETENAGCPTLFEDSNLGYRHENLSLWGTYLHGIFDSDEFRNWFFNSMRKARGIPELSEKTRYEIESSIDLLAETVRENVDMKIIYKGLGL